MPSKLTYTNRYGNEIEDTLDEVGEYDNSDDDYSYKSFDDEENSESEYESVDDESDDIFDF